LTGLSIIHFPNWWRRLRRRPSTPSLFVPNPEGPALPLKLHPGEEWKVSALQGGIEDAAREQKWKRGLYIAVHHSMSTKFAVAKIHDGLKL
jgi:hypothetical protein